MPHTGGMGTTLFTIGGVVLLAAAGTLFVVSRRKQQHS
ncbi:LPXTG cell wall anchor domain-containing protein [Anaeromassilibacillus sp. D41t1_190614_C2]